MLYWRSIDPKRCMPDFVQDIVDLCGPSEYNWYVTTGFRSIAESDRLYALYISGAGSKAAPGGKSPHNFGLAVDLALDNAPDSGLQPTWDANAGGWVWLRQVVDAHPRLRGGWHFGDGDHVERVNWQDFKSWAA